MVRFLRQRPFDEDLAEGKEQIALCYAGAAPPALENISYEDPALPGRADIWRVGPFDYAQGRLSGPGERGGSEGGAPR
jgi:hypothetical protein